MESDILPYWFGDKILNSIIWAGDNAAVANFPTYEKEMIAGGITLCVVRGGACVAAAPLSSWLFASEPSLVVLRFSLLLFVFRRLLPLAVGPPEDRGSLLVWWRLMRPGWLWVAKSEGESRENRREITLLAELQSVIRLWRVLFPREISIIWSVPQCDKMTADMKVKLYMAH